LNCGESDPLRIEIGHGMTAYTCRRKTEKDEGAKTKDTVESYAQDKN